MPGKHARRHFSQLSEFERGLIIGMKTAGWSKSVLLARWIVRSGPLEIVGRVDTRRYPRVENRMERRGERIEGSCGELLWTLQ
ncbi:hypothetical protein TNCV_4380161 [Trichonephila clavipes]|nr:hypothetical protein TNCV_4380161 [Trichonephila clavipes]